MLVNEKGEIYPDKVPETSGSWIISLVISLGILIGIIALVVVCSANHIPAKSFIPHAGMLFLILIFCITVTIVAFDREHTEYEIQNEGIYLASRLFAKQLITWNEFREVCLCYSGIHRDFDNIRCGYAVICFVRLGALKRSNGRWNTDGLFNYRYLITMNYTYELYQKVKEKCPLEVVDLRDTPEYSLTEQNL